MAAAGCSSVGTSTATVGAPTEGDRVEAWEAAAGRLACKLRCREHEPLLARAMEPWWDHGLRREALEEACDLARDARVAESYMGAIAGGRIFLRCCGRGCDFFEQPDMTAILSVVADIAEEIELPDMHFLFNVGDQPFPAKILWTPVPQMHWVWSEGHWSIPLPNPYQLRAYQEGWLGDGGAWERLLVPWEEKSRKVYWRGALSGPDIMVPSDLEATPRLRLLRLAGAHPELFDVEVVSLDPEFFSRLPDGLRPEEVLGRPVGEEVHMASMLPRFRYVVNVAAVLSSWRLTELLASGSVLLLQEDSTSEVLLELLKPWEHFVPISASLSDLVEKVEWLEAHSDEARAIAERGLALFRRRVRRQDTFCYTMQAFSALASLITPPERTQPLPPPSRFAADKRWKELPPKRRRPSLGRRLAEEAEAAALAEGSDRREL